MADKLVDTNSHFQSDEKNALFGPYWINSQIGVIVFIDNLNSASNVSISRTTDGGDNWTATQIEGNANNAKQLCAWFDQETPGDDGTLIHIGWMDFVGHDVKYVNVDISNGSIGTIRNVDTGVTVSTTNTFNKIAITKTVSGNILIAFSTQNEIECYKSDDLFATAGTSIADPYETTIEEDWLLLYPANTGDNNDAIGIFWDRSENEISIKMYDDSVNDWTETSISGSMVDSLSRISMDAAVRHSDNHLLFAAHSDDDNIADNLKTWDLTVDNIDSPTITAKTNIFTGQDHSTQVAVLINQQNNDVYLGYLKGATSTTTARPAFHKSGDDMGTWDAEVVYGQSSDDHRLIHGGRTIGDSGGRVQWSFYDDDQFDIYVNLVNDIEIAGPSVGFTRKIKISGTFQDKPIKTKVGGVFVDKPIKIKVGGTFQDV